MRTMLIGIVALIALGTVRGGMPVESSVANSALGDPAQHPVVGSWSSAKLLATFSADGTASALDADGHVYLGAWQPISENGATYDLQTLLPDGSVESIIGPLLVNDSGNTMVTKNIIFNRIIPPDPESLDFANPGER